MRKGATLKEKCVELRVEEAWSAFCSGPTPKTCVLDRLESAELEEDRQGNVAEIHDN